MQNIKIPQNVQIEDKLVGPFSLKQLLLIALGGGFSYVLYASISKSVGYVPVAAHMVIWLPGILSAAFALVRINDLSLFRCCLLIIEMMSKPRKRSLLPRQGLVINIQTGHGARSSTRSTNAGSPQAERRAALTHLLDEGSHGKLQSTLQRVDTVFDEKGAQEETAHRRRLDSLFADMKKRGLSVRSHPSP